MPIAFAQFFVDRKPLGHLLPALGSLSLPLARSIGFDAPKDFGLHLTGIAHAVKGEIALAGGLYDHIAIAEDRRAKVRDDKAHILNHAEAGLTAF